MEKRKKSIYVGAPACFKLELACQHLHSAYGAPCYLVGSSLERPDWRDIDIVLMLSDEDFFREFPNTTEHTYEFDAKWLLHTVALSNWLKEQTGLPVDFKIQPTSRANALHHGPRNALGLMFTKKEETE